MKKEKKHIITIAGRPGSGKSTAAKLVALELDFNHFSSGDLFRALGKKRGVDVLQANKAGSITEELDRLVDRKLQEIGRSDDRLVIDSRTAWHWIPNSFKVFLDLDLDSAAKRILNELNEERLNSENIHQDPRAYAQLLEHRLQVETKRYKKLYQIDPYNMNNYDLVVDTSKNDIQSVVNMIIAGFKSWIAS
jgi:CMP/dCMP kinase